MDGSERGVSAVWMMDSMQMWKLGSRRMRLMRSAKSMGDSDRSFGPSRSIRRDAVSDLELVLA